MEKPQKTAKAQPRVRRRLADDQLLLETQCGFCGKIFPDPTSAVDHLEQEHKRERMRSF